MRRLKAANQAGERAGKGATLVTKELAFDERRWNRGAADPDHWQVPSWAGVVNGLGEDLLADTGFAQNQHRRVRGCHMTRQRENITNGLAPVDDRALGLKRGHLGAYAHVVSERSARAPLVHSFLAVPADGQEGNIGIERPRWVVRVGIVMVDPSLCDRVHVPPLSD